MLAEELEMLVLCDDSLRHHVQKIRSEDVIEGFAAANGVDLIGLDDKIRCYEMRTEVSR